MNLITKDDIVNNFKKLIDEVIEETVYLYNRVELNEGKVHLDISYNDILIDGLGGNNSEEEVIVATRDMTLTITLKYNVELTPEARNTLKDQGFQMDYEDHNVYLKTEDYTDKEEYVQGHTTFTEYENEFTDLLEMDDVSGVFMDRDEFIDEIYTNLELGINQPHIEYIKSLLVDLPKGGDLWESANYNVNV